MGNDINQKIKELLSSAKVGHAYLITGPDKEHRLDLGMKFAEGLLCREHLGTACGKCDSCIKFLAGTHPDFVKVTHEKPGTIGVDDIRYQISDGVNIRPYYGFDRVYLMDEADLMTPQAQNALLKTLEEPPEYVRILLLADTGEALLDTIRSRVINLDIREEDRKAYPHLREEAELMAGINELPRTKLLQVLEKLNEGDAEEFFSFLLDWYRDLLIYKKTGSDELIQLREVIPEIKRAAYNTDYIQIEKSLRAIDKAQNRLNANVNRELSLELMLMVMGRV